MLCITTAYNYVAAGVLNSYMRIFSFLIFCASAETYTLLNEIKVLNNRNIYEKFVNVFLKT